MKVKKPMPLNVNVQSGSDAVFAIGMRTNGFVFIPREDRDFSLSWVTMSGSEEIQTGPAIWNVNLSFYKNKHLRNEFYWEVGGI